MEFCRDVAEAVVGGGDEETWATLGAFAGQLEQRGWKVGQAIALLQCGVRDASLLTEGTDPRSEQIVRLHLPLTLISAEFPLITAGCPGTCSSW